MTEAEKAFEWYWGGNDPEFDMSLSPKNYAEAAWFAATERTARRWIPVSERLPEKNTWNLVCYEGNRMPLGSMSHWFDGERFKDISSWPVTHWMPLPEPPDAIAKEFGLD